MKKILFTIAFLTLGMGASAQQFDYVHWLDDAKIQGRWEVTDYNEYYDKGLPYEYRGLTPGLLQLTDGPYTALCFRGNPAYICNFKGYWITCGNTNSYFLHLLPWNSAESIVNFVVTKFENDILKLETYDRKGLIVFARVKEENAVRSVPADTTANAKAYNLGGVELPTPDAAKGIVIQGGKKTVRR